MADEARSRFRHFDGMAWPDPHALGELAWRLTWTPATLTREDHLLLAAVAQAYGQLVADGREKRERVCRELRKHP